MWNLFGSFTEPFNLNDYSSDVNKRKFLRHEYVENLSNVDLHIERSIKIILRIVLTLFSGH